MSENRMDVQSNKSEPWSITLIDTGDETMTGGRLKQVARFLDSEPFCFTYGDGLSDVNISDLIAFHRQGHALATLTAVQPPGRFGALDLEKQKITGFREKPDGDGGRINGGFFVLSPKVIDYIEGDATIWEGSPMENLAKDGQLSAYLHDGFWHPMDTLRDRNALEDLWDTGKAPWKVWE
jgi:glucose-1-phosphate cytidylyltransferase